MKFILRSTSGRMYDIPTTAETIVKVVRDRWGNERRVESICDVCEVNTIEDLTNMVDRLNNEVIIGRELLTKDYWSLEIYDDYRE